MSDIVESVYNNYKGIIEYFDKENQISFRSLADDNLKKNLILSSASYFENKITLLLTDYFEEKNKNTICIKEFLVNKGLKRQYHTLFDWEANNANTFFALFGQGFKDFMRIKLQDEKVLTESIVAFLELGRERNRLVHQNFAVYNIEKTLDEIYMTYTKSIFFVDNIINFVEEYHSKKELQ